MLNWSGASSKDRLPCSEWVLVVIVVEPSATPLHRPLNVPGKRSSDEILFQHAFENDCPRDEKSGLGIEPMYAFVGQLVQETVQVDAPGVLQVFHDASPVAKPQL